MGIEEVIEVPPAFNETLQLMDDSEWSLSNSDSKIETIDTLNAKEYAVMIIIMMMMVCHHLVYMSAGVISSELGML